MRSDIRTSTPSQVFRQPSSVALAAVGAGVGLVLLLSLALSWADDPQPVFAAWVLLGLALAWAVFARPAVVFDVEGVTLRNIVRNVHIPWGRLTHVECRWNLVVFVQDKGYTAWAVSSQPERSRGTSGGMFARMVPGGLDGAVSRGMQASASTAKVTAQSVAASIMGAKREYAAALPPAQRAKPPEGAVQVRWAPLVMVVLLLPAIAVVTLSLA